jgi:hypothetical protein
MKRGSETVTNSNVSRQGLFDDVEIATGGGSTLMSNRKKPKYLKQLFDSEYLRPQENERVIQDDDPNKNATWK